MVTPKLVSEFTPKKVDKARDEEDPGQPILHAVNPLGNLWTGLTEQGLVDDSQGLIPVPDILDTLGQQLFA